MPSLITRKTATGHSYAIQFEMDGHRKTIGLGKVKSIDHAQRIAHKLADLITARQHNLPLNSDLQIWIDKLPNGLSKKLKRLGLIENTELRVTTLDNLVTAYLDYRKDEKPNTLKTINTSGKRLTEYFGNDRAISEITEVDYRRYEKQLRQSKRFKNDNNQKLSPATVGRMTVEAKLIFQFAVQSKWIAANPLYWATKGQYANPEKARYIDRESIDKVIDACPDAQWRLIVALARLAGLRIPSEIAMLTWDCVDWDARTILIRSPKTENHQGRGQRTIPIFADLRPYLEDCYNLAQPGLKSPLSATVIDLTRNRSGNLATNLKRIIKRAGLTVWPKLFNNLRASCATDIAKNFGPNVESAWLGHTTKIAKAHYWTPTKADFDLATGNSALQKRCGIASNNVELHSDINSNMQETAGKCIVLNLDNDSIGRAGFEPATKGL